MHPDLTETVDKSYCASLSKYTRRKTRVVNIGNLAMGGDNPIRVQSMTVVDTMDTNGSVDQILRMVEAGCEYVRITAPSLKEAQNLQEIKNELRKRGCDVPLIADIHFTPNAAELAARIVEKVRVNPGNYADKKKFEVIDYSEEAYDAELKRIREKFTPLVHICKEYGTAMRIGTNHGSLSDRILSRYGDTPLGMVESALEFLRICEDLNYYDIVLSMKASNTQVMVQAYRLLVKKLEEGGFQPYPLHLGVTEAGEGEDGRIKSAVGIGTLLEDGLGDTVRVSLTEDPELEVPVAQTLVERYITRKNHGEIEPVDMSPINPFFYSRRLSTEVSNIGEENVPRVIADMSDVPNVSVKDLKNIGHFYLPELDKWKMNDQGSDYVYSGSNPIQFMLPNGLREIVDFSIWQSLSTEKQKNTSPLIRNSDFAEIPKRSMSFLLVDADSITKEFIRTISSLENCVLIIETSNEHAMAALRAGIFRLIMAGSKIPLIVRRSFEDLTDDALQLYAATDFGGLLIDGMGDGVWLSTEKLKNKTDLLHIVKNYNQISFGVLQAARTRMSKTEYISCPSCGRTLFDLQETTAMIRKRTDHLKGVKIGIMGCIVNGPGEMADADFGYVGSGRGKITLYKGQKVIKRGVPSKDAVEELIQIIREDGKWLEPEKVE